MYFLVFKFILPPPPLRGQREIAMPTLLANHPQELTSSCRLDEGSFEPRAVNSQSGAITLSHHIPKLSRQTLAKVNKGQKCYQSIGLPLKGLGHEIRFG